ncbi:hypothetical protein SDC9_189325 [bioreactor metagenome]|uniref:Uncharacterized protein n=1 Tax=bioreactor metagenome TaxID=1076179 RepID=A0A645HSE6_9ZZZZ
MTTSLWTARRGPARWRGCSCSAAARIRFTSLRKRSWIPRGMAVFPASGAPIRNSALNFGRIPSSPSVPAKTTPGRPANLRTGCCGAATSTRSSASATSARWECRGRLPNPVWRDSATSGWSVSTISRFQAICRRLSRPLPPRRTW